LHAYVVQDLFKLVLGQNHGNLTVSGEMTLAFRLLVCIVLQIRTSILTTLAKLFKGCQECARSYGSQLFMRIITGYAKLDDSFAHVVCDLDLLSERTVFTINEIPPQW
jgi:hypothetical protein